MTTYTTLADSTLAQDKPVTQTVVRALRDNPLSIQEGDATAPKIAPGALHFPYFMAHTTTTQSGISTTNIKVHANVKDYDPDTLYDNVTNYRFTPNKAGLYRVYLYVEGAAAGTAATQIAVSISKNGSVVATMRGDAQSSVVNVVGVCATIVQMNGSTDYLEGFVSFVNDVTGSCSLTAARFLGHAVCMS